MVRIALDGRDGITSWGTGIGMHASKGDRRAYFTSVGRARTAEFGSWHVRCRGRISRSEFLISNFTFSKPRRCSPNRHLETPGFLSQQQESSRAAIRPFGVADQGIKFDCQIVSTAIHKIEIVDHKPELGSQDIEICVPSIRDGVHPSRESLFNALGILCLWSGPDAESYVA